MNFLIFSKNRAAQLELLISSIYENYYSEIFSISIIYKCDEKFTQSYKVVKDRYIINYDINWINESNFEDDVISSLKKFGTKLVCLLTDDTVFFRKFTEHCPKNFNSTFSYRLGYNTIIQDEYSNTLQPFLIPDERFEDIVSWNPNKYPAHINYGYPFSFDGHVYYADFLLSCINSQFKTTNDLEGILHNQREKIEFISSNLHSSCVNCPINNLSGLTLSGKKYPLSIDQCNAIILSGCRLRFPSVPIHACHQEIKLNVV